jgi:antitoxin component of MazEF toxin-antitoxin module
VGRINIPDGSRTGNSVGVTIPKPIRDSLNFEVGDDVELVDKEITFKERG